MRYKSNVEFIFTMNRTTREEGGEYHVALTHQTQCSLSNTTIHLLQNMLKSKDKRRSRRVESVKIIENSFNRGMDILPPKFLTWKQEEFWQTMQKKTVTLAAGAAGTGKTLVALHFGLHGVSTGLFEKVFYIRSDVGVEFQRGRGALPGEMSDKIAPLVAPISDNLPCIMRSKGAADYLLNKKIIEPILLEDVRGRSFNDCFIIVDEAQNFIPEQIKTCLTRVSRNSKICLTGDTSQADLEVFRSRNGLLDAMRRLKNIHEVGMVEFSREDIVRNGVIADILQAYED